jgi:predicted ATP-grasp superfamily ATP-dependent carboligase
VTGPRDDERGQPGKHPRVSDSFLTFVRALILDQGFDRASLTAARALASAGWTVGSGSHLARGLAGRSHAVTRCHRIPAARAGAEALVVAANSAIAEGGYEVVFSCNDAGVLGLSLHRDKLHAAVPYGHHLTLVRGFDKLELTREAQRVGLAVPRTEPVDESQLESFGAGMVVVKPRFTFLEGVDDRIRASIVTGTITTRERAREMQEAGAEPILQEYVEGQLIALTAVTDRDARIVARVQQVADLTWPLGVGVSAYARTVTVDERLAAGAGRLLEALGWFGLAELQFIVGSDGVPRLIDLNGRFYGSLALAVAAGLNLPAIWARLATDRPVGLVPEARCGVRYQRFSGDLRASLASAARHGRMRAALGSAARAPGATHSLWSARDPWPAISQFGSKLAGWISPS